MVGMSFFDFRRLNITRLTDIFTGHCALNKHFNVMGQTNSSKCHKCGELETAEYFLCHYPAHYELVPLIVYSCRKVICPNEIFVNLKL